MKDTPSDLGALYCMNERPLFIYLLLSYIKREIENPEGINDGANAFDQHNLRQLFPRSKDLDCDGRKCTSDDDCCRSLVRECKNGKCLYPEPRSGE